MREELGTWTVPSQEGLTLKYSVVGRSPECVNNWPDCESMEYNPRCCRFPKSCSCQLVEVEPENLEWLRENKIRAQITRIPAWEQIPDAEFTSAIFINAEGDLRVLTKFFKTLKEAFDWWNDRVKKDDNE